MSIRPFLHRVETGSGGTGEAKQTVRTEKDVEKIEAEEKTAFVSEAFTAEGAKEGLAKGEQSDIFSGPLRVQWGQVAYIIIRDQVRACCSVIRGGEANGGR
jgi:transcription antitermination factor NusG